MLKKIFLFTALFWTGVILFFCLENASDIPQINIPNIDKLIHAFFHYVFTLLWFLFFKKNSKSLNNFRPLVYSYLFSFIFGIAIELMQQYLTDTRTADVFDVLANTTGASFAVFSVLILNKFTRIVDKI